MSTTITYNGSTIGQVSNETKTLLTSGKWLTGNIVLTDSSSGSGGSALSDSTPSDPTYETYFDDSITANNKEIAIASLADLYFANGERWRVTWDGVEYICQTNIYQGWLWTIGNLSLVETDNSTDEPFCLYNYGSGFMAGNARTAGTHTLKLEKQTSSGGGSSVNLGTKTITVNGTYSASNDSLDGYSSVIVNVPATVPNLQSKTVTPTTSTQTITADANYDGLSSVEVSAITIGTAGTPTASKGTVSNHSVSITPSVTNTTGYITGGIKTGTAITVTASELASGNKEITSNGTNIDVVGYSTVSVAIPASSKNVQTVQSTTRRNNTALGSITSLTCSTAGTYDVYWTCARSSTSQTWGSQLYINGTAYDTENTTWSNNVQNNHLTGVVLSANATVAVYGRSRSGYYIHAPQLTIVQTA